MHVFKPGVFGSPGQEAFIHTILGPQAKALVLPVFLRFLSLVFFLQGQATERVLEQVIFKYIFH